MARLSKDNLRERRKETMREIKSSLSDADYMSWLEDRVLDLQDSSYRWSVRCMTLERLVDENESFRF